MMKAARSSPHTDSARSNLLGIYLNDHLAGATAAVGLAKRLAGAHRSRQEAELLREFVHEIEQDRTALLTMMDELEIPVRQYKVTAAQVTELIGRAKMNGRLLSRSPLSDVIELEGLRLGVEANAAAWRTLYAQASTEPRLDANWLESLIDGARRQGELLEELRVRAAIQAFDDQSKGAGE